MSELLRLVVYGCGFMAAILAALTAVALWVIKRGEKGDSSHD